MIPWLQVPIFLAGFTLGYLGVRWYWKWLDRKDEQEIPKRGWPGDEKP